MLSRIRMPDRVRVDGRTVPPAFDDPDARL